jgi:hypothetical protein
VKNTGKGVREVLTKFLGKDGEGILNIEMK